MTVDDLTEHGIERMDDEAISGFLSSQQVGVLGLPTDGAPTMRPLSFVYDGEDCLYLHYIVGSESEKATASDRASAARFLVYKAETTFNWRSVLLTGQIDAVPDAERDALEDQVTLPWQPDRLDAAGVAEGTTLYRFTITDWQGLKHAGLPDGFELLEGED